MSESRREEIVDDVRKSQSLLVKSAQGASFLILLQIGSRALTFIVNQVLLRYLSPALLGISTQLDLYVISVLYFARESLRVALQRRRDDSRQDEKSPKQIAASYESARRAQEVINLSYVAISLGFPLAYLLAKLYLRNAEAAVLNTPYLYSSLNIYAIASILELLNEPCFAISQQQMLYATRASAETLATFTRCLVACATAVWASRTHHDLGVLPFALGQLTYSTILNAVYFTKIYPTCAKSGFSLLLKPLTPSQAPYLLSRFSLPASTLALNLYAQSALKHLLTSGDSFLMATLTSLPTQGAYSLASNYGSLLARILFQPIEESSRGLFGRLLAPSSANTTATPEGVIHGRAYLRTILHLYSLLSMLAMSVGPTFAPLLLRYVAGSRWSSTPASDVLAAYCYYIPLLAINGILEAFVSSIATPTQLRMQSAWMFAFSAAFAGTGFVVLRVYDLGARGLVLANAVNMAMRIWWSWGFVNGYLEQKGAKLGITEMFPTVGTRLLGITAAFYLKSVEKTFNRSVADLVKWVAVAGSYGVVLLFFERVFLYQCYQMLQTPQSISKASKKDS